MNEIKVGLLTLLAIASMVIVTIKISGKKRDFGPVVEYKTIIEDASGIFPNSSIKVAGIHAGLVKKVELSGSQALVTFEVKEEIKVTKFSNLRIKSVGFLGDKYMDIYLGDLSAERLPSGSMVASEVGAGFEELGKDASVVLKDIKVITQAVKESLYDENKENIVKKVIKNVEDISEQIKEVSRSLNTMMKNNDERIQNILKNIDSTAKNLAFETDRFKEGSLLNDLDEIGPILANVRKVSDDLKLIVSDVEAGKGTVGKLLRDEQVVDQVNQTLSGVNRLVNRINNFKTNVSIYSGVNSRFSGRTDFNLDLIPAPERFFRFGLVNNDFGPKVYTDTTTTTSVNGGAESVETKREVDETAFKFNLQIGRKIGSFALRAGFIETTGGVGLDYNLPDYGFYGFAEVFDYQEDIGPNLRLGAEYRMWNVFFTRVMLEDAMSSYGEQSYTVSVGLKFTDDDLAALLGLASSAMSP